MSTVTAPDRSLEQRREALKQANDVRMGRAKLKREIKAGRVTVAGLLLDPPELIATMKVLDLLLASRRVGLVKANKLLSRARISPSRTVSGVPARQRGELVRSLGGFCEEETAA